MQGGHNPKLLRNPGARIAPPSADADAAQRGAVEAGDLERDTGRTRPIQRKLYLPGSPTVAQWARGPILHIPQGGEGPRADDQCEKNAEIELGRMSRGPASVISGGIDAENR
ncbi:MAG: hypothetical protein Q9159_001304 [Coniocarpon cinnabarinum]